MATPVSPNEFQQLREEAIEALARAHTLPVQSCYRVLVDYQPKPDHDSPHYQHTAHISTGDFLHLKTRYDSEWWIGRVVGHETGMRFIPGEEKLRSCVQTETGDEVDKVFEKAPVMRPLVLLGPSNNDSKLNRLLQKPLLNYMREKFSDRLVTVKPDHPINKELSSKETRNVEGEVYAASTTMKLVFLDCIADYPEDFDNTRLHPHFIYLKIAKQKVLQELIKQLTKSSRTRQDQLDSAGHLFENSSKCSLIISDSNVDDACLTLELFLESYWAATRSVVLVQA